MQLIFKEFGVNGKKKAKENENVLWSESNRLRVESHLCDDSEDCHSTAGNESLKENMCPNFVFL